MEKYKAICFFDLDGTLLNKKSLVDKEVVDAIHQLKKNNILPLIATGRNIKEIEHITNLVDIHSIVALDGQVIQLEGEIIYKNTLSIDLIDRFIEFSQKMNSGLSFYTPHDYWAYEITDVMKSAYSTANAPLPPVDKERHKREEVSFLLGLTSKVEEDECYKKEFPELNFFRNQPYSFDIVSKENDKGSGIRHLLEYLGHTDIPTYAFGDGNNDVPLLKAATVGIAMGNSVPATLEVADYVTASHTEGGIIQALKHFGMIE